MEKQFFISFIQLIDEVQGKSKLPSQAKSYRKSAWCKQISNPKQKKDALARIWFLILFSLLIMELPKIGDVKVYLNNVNGYYTVDVRFFKENTLRGDAYWVTKEYRKFNKEKDAIKFASRFN